MNVSTEDTVMSKDIKANWDNLDYKEQFAIMKKLFDQSRVTLNKTRNWFMLTSEVISISNRFISQYEFIKRYNFLINKHAIISSSHTEQDQGNAGTTIEFICPKGTTALFDEEFGQIDYQYI